MQWIDTTLGKVRIEKQLAKGGMAEVYLGTHLTLDRPVAIKVLHNFVEEDEVMKSRFQREARVVAALRHPNIVQIHDFDTVDGHRKAKRKLPELEPGWNDQRSQRWLWPAFEW
ncbi:MAG: protein kinase [Chloroflexota bacterium]